MATSSSTSQSSFFTYYCDQCDAMFCERIQVMNLALNHVEEQYCLSCLASEERASIPALTSQLYDYIQSRDCFRDPWRKFDATRCPLQKENTCYCQDLG